MKQRSRMLDTGGAEGEMKRVRKGDMVRRHPVLIQHVLSGEMLLRRIEANR